MHTQLNDAMSTVDLLGNWIVAPVVPQQFPDEIYRPTAESTTTNVWQLWEAEQNHFHRLALRWLNGNADDAAEGLNRAAIKVWQAASDATNTIANPMGWLTGLVRHTCLDLHREQHRHSRHLESLDGDGSEAMAHECIAAPRAQSPEAHLLLREKYAYIHAAIDALPVRLRTPLILRCGHELSYEVIGTRLNLAPGNVRKRIQAARTILRSQLRAYQQNRADPSLLAPWPEAHGFFEYDVDMVTTDSDDSVNTAVQPRVTMLDQISKREVQKLGTLRAYVARHPTGWKKQLALADQLCKMGHNSEAIDAYRQVLQKQPQLLSVWLQAGRLYQALGQDEDAIAAYEQALPLAKGEAGRAYVCGLLESVASAAVVAG